MMFTRRNFAASLVSGAFGGLALASCARTAAVGPARAVGAYGALKVDPAGLLDLPNHFSYRIISRVGDVMDDGFTVPDRADGMGAFRIDASRMALVRNHELQPKHQDEGPFRAKSGAGLAGFDARPDGQPLPGGTTTMIYNYRTGQIESQHLSLTGTIRNCAGGTTPWGSWLTCEEDVSRAGTGGLTRDHGWVFEVPAQARGLTAPLPLTAMGRFNHEAAAVDPRTGIVYLTEDRADGLFYRFLPTQRGALARGGRLQALTFRDRASGADSRNWSGAMLPEREWRNTEWIDLDEPESPQDDLRARGHAKGAVLFARGEGIEFGRGELYFTCTSGGAIKAGQVMRYRPSRFEGQSSEHSDPGALQLFVESDNKSQLDYADNLTIAPNGHLIICEDQGGANVSNHLRGVTPRGALYPLALLREQTELAGACFSPDGATLFVNVYQPGRTLAITGPWGSFAG